MYIGIYYISTQYTYIARCRPYTQNFTSKCGCGFIVRLDPDKDITYIYIIPTYNNCNISVAVLIGSRDAKVTSKKNDYRDQRISILPTLPS